MLGLQQPSQQRFINHHIQEDYSSHQTIPTKGSQRPQHTFIHLTISASNLKQCDLENGFLTQDATAEHPCCIALVRLEHHRL